MKNYYLAGASSADSFSSIRARGDLLASISAGGVDGRGVSIRALTAGSVRDVSITVPGGIHSIAVTEWADTDEVADAVSAAWIGRLTTRGQRANPRRGIEAADGDFQADLTLTGADGRGTALGAARIAGQVTGSWNCAGGGGGTITAGSTAAGWALDAAGAVRSLRTMADLAGVISADSFGSIVARGDLLASITASGADARGASVGSLRAGSVRDVSITVPGGIHSITVTEWADTDETADTVSAAWIGRLTTRGQRANARRGIEAANGDFQADLALTGEGLPARRPTLASARVAGSIADRQWQIDGDVTAVRVAGSLSNWALEGNGAGLESIRSLTLGDVASATVTVQDVLGTVRAQRWAAGAIEADSIRTLRITGYRGNAARGIDPIAGNFGAALVVTGRNVVTGRTALGSATVAGDLAGSLWKVSGRMGRLSIAGTASNSTVRAGGSIAGITLGATSGSDFLAGVDVDNDHRHADAPQDFASLGAKIESVRIRGLASSGIETIPPVGEPQRFFVDSNFTAASFGSIQLLNVDFDNGESGFHALGGSGHAAFRAIRNTDRITGENWSWSARQGWPVPGPSDFFRVL